MQGGAFHGAYMSEALRNALPPDTMLVIGDEQELCDPSAPQILTDKPRFAGDHLSVVKNLSVQSDALSEDEATAITAAAAQQIARKE